MRVCAIGAECDWFSLIKCAVCMGMRWSKDDERTFSRGTVFVMGRITNCLIGDEGLFQGMSNR